jgi:dihydroorotate dehydrogenase (NAD+) catalytic subunit
MLDLSVKIGSFTLSKPVIAASGTFGFGFEVQELTDYKNLGAFVTKTITFNPRVGNPPPRIFETDCGVLNSIGLQNPGIKHFTENIVPQMQQLETPFIISIAAADSKGFAELAKRLRRVKCAAIELNLSCPNVDKKRLVAQDSQAVAESIKAVKEVNQSNIIAKLTPEVTDIGEVAAAAAGAGVDAISLVNSFYGMAIDINKRVPRLGKIYGGYSGHAIKPLALYRVFKVAQAVKIPIIGGGGIFNGDDALEFFLAGADAISVGTMHLVEPDGARALMTRIEQYMQSNNINNLAELKKYLIGGDND